MVWKDFGRPGYFGKKRDEIFSALDYLFGEGNWRISWKWLGQDIDFRFACHLYEDAYYKDSFEREGLWKKLLEQAGEVYDYEKEDILSGFDYETQRGKATHLQDIAIRKTIARRGWKFKGKKPVQVRSHKTYWGCQLNPGKVPFHLPEYIIPGLATESALIDKISVGHSPFVIWWDKDSIEDFYQSNKFIQVRELDKNNISSLLTELNVIEEDFSRKKEAHKREVSGIKSLLQSETDRRFRQVVGTINAKLKGKAPAIKGFNVEGNCVDLTLNCNYEDLLGEEGDLINTIVRHELEKAGLGWIWAHISPYYYGK